MLLLLLSLALADEPPFTVSVRGVGPFVGHTSSIVVDPTVEMAHGGSGTIRIDGPRGFRAEIPVHLSPPPPRRLPACDPSPDDPHGCDNQPDFEPLGLFNGLSVASPTWPRAGTYTLTLELARGGTVGPEAFDVEEHPLAGFVVVPRGYDVTIRTIDPFKRSLSDTIVHSPSLYVCAEDGSSELCLRVTEPIGERCPDVLAAAGPKRSWVGEGRTAYQVRDGTPTTWSWCSGGRLLEIKPRFVPSRDRDFLLERLFRLAPSDGGPP